MGWVTEAGTGLGLRAAKGEHPGERHPLRASIQRGYHTRSSVFQSEIRPRSLEQPVCPLFDLFS
jgi:hypothetical protein